MCVCVNTRRAGDQEEMHKGEVIVNKFLFVFSFKVHRELPCLSQDRKVLLNSGSQQGVLFEPTASGLPCDY